MVGVKQSWYAINGRLDCCQPKQIRRYKMICNKYFKPYKALNCGIAGDRTQHVLWREVDLSVPPSVKYVAVHCGTSNLDNDEPKIIVINGIIKVGKVFQENLTADVKIISTGLLPRDLNKSKRRYKILKVNNYLKKSCKDETNIY